MTLSETKMRITSYTLLLVQSVIAKINRRKPENMTEKELEELNMSTPEKVMQAKIVKVMCRNTVE